MGQRGFLRWRLEGRVLRDGDGIFLTAAGDRYEGEWLAGQRSGKGMYTAANGDKYSGQWKGDMADGKGKFFWANGDKYVGNMTRDNHPEDGIIGRMAKRNAFLRSKTRA